MKAKELYDKYKLDYTNNGHEKAGDILLDLANELLEIKKSRKIQKMNSFQAVIKGQQSKLDCLNKLFKQKHGVNIFVEKAFEKYIEAKLKEINNNL